MLGFKLSQATSQALRFAKLRRAIKSAIVRRQQDGNRVPTVRLHLTWSAVISGHDDDIGIQLRYAWHCGVEFFGTLHLQWEIAVFARGIGVLPVDEEEVIIVPGCFQTIPTSPTTNHNKFD